MKPARPSLNFASYREGGTKTEIDPRPWFLSAAEVSGRDGIFTGTVPLPFCAERSRPDADEVNPNVTLAAVQAAPRATPPQEAVPLWQPVGALRSAAPESQREGGRPRTITRAATDTSPSAPTLQLFHDRTRGQIAWLIGAAVVAAVLGIAAASVTTLLLT